MTRYKLMIEYDGGGFVGWQRQENGPSVQAALEAAVAAFCGETVTVQGAGRTDAGVHARGQIAHLDLETATTADTVRDALNAHLRPLPVAVLSVDAVDETFHARFNATRRTYLYRIINRRAPLALDRGRAWFVPAPLDAAAMHEAAQVLLGRHDFTTFRARECQARTPVKTLDRLDVIRHGDEIRLNVEARSFLYHQVRILAGTLRKVGSGAWGRNDLAQALAARDRARAGETAPACGLFLVSVGYD